MSQVDLIATQYPNTVAMQETVVVTVDVTFAGDPQQNGGTLRLSLSIQQAEVLAGQIQPALYLAHSARKHREGR